jgi:nucleoid-associated protein YgaU
MAYDEAGLRGAVELTAWAVAGVGLAMLALAVAAEILRRSRSHSPLLAVADRLLPSASRRVAIAVLTLASTVVALAGAPGARADGHVGDWLAGATSSTSSTTTTTTTTPTTTPLEPPDTTGPAAADAPPDGVSAPVIRSAPAATTTPTTSTRAPAPPDPTPEPAVPAPAAPAPSPAGAPVVGAPAITPPVELAPPAVVDAYTVVPGDCLWDIARRRLGPRATNAAIDRGWRAIYAANLAGVGADPNLIHPGLVLALPPLDPTP